MSATDDTIAIANNMTILLTTLILIALLFISYQQNKIMKLLKSKQPLAEILDDDELYVEAERVVCEAGKASTSFIQRKLGIGYARACCLLDSLEEKGVIGAADGIKPRKILKHK